jgi:hypothetical protein
LSRLEVNELLGRADHRYLNSDIYVLSSSPCAYASLTVELYYENNHLSKYRSANYCGESDWVALVRAHIHG